MRRNPYLNRSMIRAVDQFHGRSREIARAMARLGGDPPQSISLVGERRVGKSSLLWHISQGEIYTRYLDKPDRYVFILLDFQGQQHLDQTGFCRLCGQYLAQAVPGRQEATYDFVSLESTIADLSREGRRLIFLFDEFEAVTRNPAFGTQFFGFLRALANAYPVAFCTVSRQDLQQLCHTRDIAESPFFNIFARIHLGPLTWDEARTLITAPSAQAELPLQEHTDALLALSGRLPFFVQMACSAAFEVLDETGLDWNQVEQRFLEEGQSHFCYLWESFDVHQRQVVAHLAAGQMPPPELAPAVKWLERNGYIDQADNQLALFSRLFDAFLTEIQDLPETPPPALAARPDTPAAETVEPTPEGETPYANIVGRGLPMRRLFTLVRKAAAADATVLVLGETGTGKELVAQTIHQGSTRAAGPFVAVNCGALAEHLQDSELFGHAKGSFTDAVADRQGLFEAASGGTLFLDEIGDTSPATQVKLLRALQEGRIRRVGESADRAVDVRLICATNKDLEDEVTQGHFRQDLFYRLHVLVLFLPPLRQRREDIPPLVEHFLDGHPIAAAAVDLMRSYPWPGNIRELENQLASARAMAEGNPVEPHHLWPRLHQLPAAQAAAEEWIDLDMSLKDARDYFERRFIQSQLQRYGDDLDGLARSLEISRSRLYDLLKRYGLRTVRG